MNEIETGIVEHDHSVLGKVLEKDGMYYHPDLLDKDNIVVRNLKRPIKGIFINGNLRELLVWGVFGKDSVGDDKLKLYPSNAVQSIVFDNFGENGVTALMNAFLASTDSGNIEIEDQRFTIHDTIIDPSNLRDEGEDDDKTGGLTIILN